MPVPNHRPDCYTRIFKTRCPDCHREVWYFDCTCGSKVFFDCKGPPWLLHMDSCPIYNAREMINQGSSPSSIKKLLRAHAEQNNQDIDPILIQFLNRMGASGKKFVKPVLPSLTPTEFSGILQKIHPINFFKRLGVRRSLITQKVLGEFGDKDYYEMVVNQPDDQDPDFINQWIFVIPVSEVDGCYPMVGTRVYGRLVGKFLFEDELVWTVDDIDWD